MRVPLLSAVVFDMDYTAYRFSNGHLYIVNPVLMCKQYAQRIIREEHVPIVSFRKSSFHEYITFKLPDWKVRPVNYKHPYSYFLNPKRCQKSTGNPQGVNQ